MQKIRIGLITTLNWNIGDEFVRDGIVEVLRSVYSGFDVRFVAIDKRKPFTVYPRLHPMRSLQVLGHLPRGRRAADALKAHASQALHRLGGSRFDRIDVIVHCGAPVMWPGCHRSVWASTLWDQVVARLSERIPVLTLAAGSAYPWEDQPQEVKDPRDADFLRRVLGSCRVTTARDELLSRLAQNLGTSAPTIPCGAFLVGRRFAFPSTDDDAIVLFNYTPGGGYWGWGQAIDHERWMATAKTLIARLSERHRVAFLCHDQKQYAVAELLNPELPRFLPTSIENYFSLISRSKGAITNRLHAAVAMASLGIPSISVGTDTRMLMVASIGLPYRYVKDAELDQLEDEFETVLTRRKDERERLISLRETTWNQYVDAVTRATSP